MSGEPRKVSRQRLWQIKMKAEGRCLICGQPRAEFSGNYCEKHHDAANEYSRVKMRRKLGIPADAPPHVNPRPIGPRLVRRHRGARKKALLERVNELIQGGLNAKEIGAELGRSMPHTYRLLSEVGAVFTILTATEWAAIQAGRQTNIPSEPRHE